MSADRQGSAPQSTPVLRTRPDSRQRREPRSRPRVASRSVRFAEPNGLRLRFTHSVRSTSLSVTALRHDMCVSSLPTDQFSRKRTALADILLASFDKLKMTLLPSSVRVVRRAHQARSDGMFLGGRKKRHRLFEWFVVRQPARPTVIS
jgi:hypothetical protein